MKNLFLLIVILMNASIVWSMNETLDIEGDGWAKKHGQSTFHAAYYLKASQFAEVVGPVGELDRIHLVIIEKSLVVSLYCKNEYSFVIDTSKWNVSQEYYHFGEDHQRYMHNFRLQLDDIDFEQKLADLISALRVGSLVPESVLQEIPNTVKEISSFSWETTFMSLRAQYDFFGSLSSSEESDEASSDDSSDDLNSDDSAEFSSSSEEEANT